MTSSLLEFPVCADGNVRGGEPRAVYLANLSPCTALDQYEVRAGDEQHGRDDHDPHRDDVRWRAKYARNPTGRSSASRWFAKGSTRTNPEIMKNSWTP